MTTNANPQDSTSLIEAAELTRLRAIENRLLGRLNSKYAELEGPDVRNALHWALTGEVQI